MPIDESWTVRPAPGARRLSGAEITEAAARLSRYHPEAAAAADVRVVTGWGGAVKRLEVSVPQLDAEDVYPRAGVHSHPPAETAALTAADAPPRFPVPPAGREPWFDST